MTSINHSAKKRFSRATLSRKTIETGIGAEFTNEKNSVVRAKTTLKQLLKLAEADRLAWQAALKAEKSFNEIIVAEAATDGDFSKVCQEGLTSLRELQASMGQKADETFVKLMMKVKDYNAKVDEVLKECKTAEQSYSEVTRYEKKVEKLMKKKKKEEKTERNLGKLANARSMHEAATGEHVRKMKEVNEGLEEVLKCASCAFWRRQGMVIEKFDKETLVMREWAKEAVDGLVGAEASA